jgi:hypothetical protein
MSSFTKKRSLSKKRRFFERRRQSSIFEEIGQQ